MMFLSKFGQKAGTAPAAMKMMQPSTRNFGAIVKADGEHKFVAPCDKKMIAFEGLKATGNFTISLNNQFRHQNDITLFK